MNKRRKLSSIEKALFIIPLLGIVLLALQGPLRSWWEQTPANRWTLPFANHANVQMMAFSNDSKLLAVLYWKEQKNSGQFIGIGRLDILDAATQEVKQSFPVSAFGLMKWSPQNDRIAFNTLPGYAVWDAMRGQQIIRRRATGKVKEWMKQWRSQDVLEIERTTDLPQKDKWLEQRAMFNIRTETMAPLTKWRTTSSSGLRLIDRSPDGVRLLYINPKSPVKENSLELWDAQTKRKIKTFKGPFDSAFFLDNRTIAGYYMGSEFGEDSSAFVTTFHINDSTIRWRKFESTNPVLFSPNQRLAAFWEAGKNTIYIRDIRTWQMTQTIFHSDLSGIMEFSPDGKQFAYCVNNRTDIKIISLNQKH